MGAGVFVFLPGGRPLFFAAPGAFGLLALGLEVGVDVVADRAEDADWMGNTDAAPADAFDVAISEPIADEAPSSGGAARDGYENSPCPPGFVNWAMTSAAAAVPMLPGLEGLVGVSKGTGGAVKVMGTGRVASGARRGGVGAARAAARPA